jgi:hypothetical protein
VVSHFREQFDSRFRNLEKSGAKIKDHLVNQKYMDHLGRVLLLCCSLLHYKVLGASPSELILIFD